jgi:hypothetical protein
MSNREKFGRPIKALSRSEIISKSRVEPIRSHRIKQEKAINIPKSRHLHKPVIDAWYNFVKALNEEQGVSRTECDAIKDYVQAVLNIESGGNIKF